MKKTMRFLSVLLTLCMVMGLLPTAVFAANSEMSFSDVDSADWFYDAVQYVYENDMMKGADEDSFAPGVTTTRGMIVTILHSMEGKPEAKGTAFPDVADGQYYADAVAWASAKGIVGGYSNGNFGPNDPITREQMVAILYKYAQFKGYDVSVGEDTNILSYADAFDISEYAIPAMQWAVGAGLISGVSGNKLAPAGNASRAEAAVILMQFNENAAQAETYTVTYMYNYGTKGVYTTDEVEAGERAVAPDAPKRSGYSFKAWYADPKDGKRYDFKTPVTGDLTLYARWGEQSSGGHSIGLDTATILRDGNDVTGAAIRSGDVLTVSVTPDKAVYSVKWMAGGVEVATTAEYTVSALDVGKTITAIVTGNSGYQGSVTAPATGAVAAVVDLETADPDTAPVVIDSDATYKDADGNDVTIDENATLTLAVEADTTTAVPEENSEAVENTLFVEYEIPEEDQAALTVNYVTVDADLIMTTTTTVEDETTGETTTTTEETEIHPVGETTLTLSKENLGIAADQDISTYTFFANHTNKAGENEVIPGELVEVNGEQCVRFVLNGLSRIYIGNVPPLTVTFNTDGGSEVPAQKVKLGGYAADVEPPVKDGWLFAGWDHDIQTENIIKDITVTALWIQGTTASDEQLTGVWMQDGEEIAEPDDVDTTMANGTVTHNLDASITYPANLSYTLYVAPMEGAVKMAYATTADGAMAAGEEDYKDAAAVPVTADVTNGLGTAQTSNTNMYIKWIDEDGILLGLQSARLVVKTQNSVPGNYDTQTRMETTPVDRGLGQVEFYLTGGVDDNNHALEDFSGVVNGYLNSNSDGYYLNLYSSFYEGFGYWDDENDTYVDVNSSHYSGIKIVIKPFEGESFSGTPELYVGYWDDVLDEHVECSDDFTAALVDGNIVITGTIPETDASYVYPDFEVTLGDKSQNFSMDIDLYNYAEEERTEVRTESWSEALAALAAGTNYVYYRGTESVTLNSALTLRPDQYLHFNNNSTEVNLTIGQGGTLTVSGDDLNGGGVYIQNGKVIVANGGVLTTNSQDEDQGRYYNTQVQSKLGLTVQNGGQLKVPARGYLRAGTREGCFNLEQGGQLINENRFYADSYGEPGVRHILAGTVTNTGDMEFNDCLTIASTGNVTTSDRSYFDVYGGLIVDEGGELTCNGRRVSLSGRSENYGTITMNAGTLEMWNTGYSVYNNGTIYVAEGAYMNIEGTVLVNTGALTGSGRLYTYEMNDASSYDNGIEYVYVEEDTERTPSNYDRYQFVRDPSATVDVIFFLGELSNQNGGTSTLTEVQ